ncbi:hypothetical protein C1645_745071 [Glomus cerebriforme]|uniref:Acyl-protein thioesterase 1 n=1 Tax=Glomus cerebriforme TaxID=658196 RepID=A0A397S3V5_9GLOM|nr:hypothetical protein C1645_745071 [Glomus cerebriforme]
MESDVVPNNPPRKNFEEADKIIHLDYPQLGRATNYVNEIIAGEIKAGIPPEKIFIAGYSQGGLLTLAMALTSQHKLGGFISLCGLLPRSWLARRAHNPKVVGSSPTPVTKKLEHKEVSESKILI